MRHGHLLALMLLAAAGCGGSSSNSQEASEPGTGTEAKPPSDEAAGQKPIEPKPAEPPAKSDLIAVIEPHTIIGLQSTEPVVKWAKHDGGDDGEYRQADGSDRYLYFAAQEFTRDGATYQLVLWETSDDTGIDGALLTGSPGRWKPVWVKRPFIQETGNAADPGVGDVQLPLLKIGPERWAVLHTPSFVGCGSAPCHPEDDFVPSRLFEVTAEGAALVWQLDNGPACRLGALDPKGGSAQCAISTAPGAATDVFDLVVATKVRKKKTSKRYVFTGGKYQPK